MNSEKEVKESTSKETKKNTNVKKKTKFTKKEKTQLAIILGVIILAIVVIILFVNIKNTSGKDSQDTQDNIASNNSDKVNNNKGVVESKQIDDLKVDNIQVKKQDGITYLYADVTNVGKDNQGDFRVHISMKDENDNEIIGFDQDLPVLSPGEKTNISIGSTDDFVDAYNCTITKVE